MVKIADLVSKVDCTEHPDCGLVVNGDTPVHEVLAKMQASGSDIVAVSTEDDGHVVISREELIDCVLAELRQTQDYIVRIEKEASEVICDEVELVRGCAVCGDGVTKSKLEVAVDYMTEGLLILDEGGCLEMGNPAAKKMLGLDPEDSLETLLGVMDDFGLRQLMAENRNTGEGNWGQFKIKSPAGKVLQIRWVKMEAEEEGKVGSLAIIRDVTDELAGEKAKTEFIAAITHELRTPLTIIQNSVSNILAGVTGKISKKTQKYLHTIEGDCGRFGALISDLLDISKLEAGNMPLNSQIIIIGDIVDEAIGRFASKARDKNLELFSQIEKAIGPIYADKDRILQVLCNFIGNAVKFTDTGKVEVRVRQDADNVIFEVVDSGIGISEVQQKHVFDKFHQIGRQAGAGYKGTGLGLAICNGVIQMHGGKIWVKSVPDSGSTFAFSLPKTEPAIILNKYIERMGRMVNSGGGKFGLMFLQVDGEGTGIEQSANIIGPLIREIIAQIDELMIPTEDLSLQTSETEAFFVLSGVKKPRIDGMVRKIEKIVKTELKNNCSEAHFVPICGTAIYPDDSCEIIGLENLARQAAKRI